jgi:antitoxin component of RelBE/YafQ-DinJ toxin-antitoxin module
METEAALSIALWVVVAFLAFFLIMWIAERCECNSLKELLLDKENELNESSKELTDSREKIKEAINAVITELNRAVSELSNLLMQKQSTPKKYPLERWTREDEREYQHNVKNAMACTCLDSLLNKEESKKKDEYRLNTEVNEEKTNDLSEAMDLERGC